MGQEGEPVPARHIHIDLQEWDIVLEGTDGRAIRFNPVESLRQLFRRAQLPLAEAPAPEAPASDGPAEAEKDPTETFSGKLKSQPKEGRVDNSGYPTAWARFAAHDESSDSLRMFSATFHRHTREIALQLKNGDSLIVEGYPHQATVPGKSDTLSVIAVHNYPGKPPKGNAT